MLDMAFPRGSQSNMGPKSFSGFWDFNANMGDILGTLGNKESKIPFPCTKTK